MRLCSFMVFLSPWLLFCPIPTVSFWSQILQNIPSHLDYFITLLVVLSVSDPSCQSNLFEISVFPCPQLTHPYPWPYLKPIKAPYWLQNEVQSLKSDSGCTACSFSYPYISSLTGVCCVLSMRTPFLLSLNPMHPQHHSCCTISCPHRSLAVRHNSC